MSDAPAPVMDQTPSIGKIAAKLAKVLGEVSNVPKTGWNDFHKYKFVTESDLSDAVRKHLAEANVFIFTSVVEHSASEVGDVGKKQLLTRVTLKHTFVDGDSGEAFSVLSRGEGADKGDKGIYKAITGATKYFLYKNFLISTNDDPENDDERGNSRQQPQQQSGGKGGGRQQQRNAQQEQKSDAGAEQKQDPALKVGDSMPAGAKWQDVVIHFGQKFKNKKLGELTDAELAAWIHEWTPNADQSKHAEFIHLRTALNVAQKEKKLPAPAK